MAPRLPWLPEVTQLVAERAETWVQIHFTVLDGFFDGNRAGILILIFPEEETRLRRVRGLFGFLWPLLTVSPKSGGLAWQKFVFSQVWGPEV